MFEGVNKFNYHKIGGHEDIDYVYLVVELCFFLTSMFECLNNFNYHEIGVHEDIDYI